MPIEALSQDERDILAAAQEASEEEIQGLDADSRAKLEAILDKAEAPAEAVGVAPSPSELASFLAGRDVEVQEPEQRQEAVQVPIIGAGQKPGTFFGGVQQGISELLESIPTEVMVGLEASAIPFTAPGEAVGALVAGKGIGGAAKAFTGRALRSLLPEEVTHSETGIQIPQVFSEKLLQDIAAGEAATARERAGFVTAQVIPAVVPFSRKPVEALTQKLIGRGINDPLRRVMTIPATPTAADKALADVMNTQQRIDFIQKSLQRQREAQRLARLDRLKAEKVAKEAAIEARQIRLRPSPAQRLGDPEAAQLQQAIEQQAFVQKSVGEADQFIARRTFGEPTSEPSEMLKARLFGQRDPALNVDFVRIAQRERLKELRPQLDEIQRRFGSDVADEVEAVFVRSAPVDPLPVPPSQQVLQPYPYDLQSALDRVMADMGVAPTVTTPMPLTSAVEKVKSIARKTVKSRRAKPADKEAIAENVAASIPTRGQVAVVPKEEAVKAAVATEAAKSGMPYSKMVRDFFEMDAPLPDFEKMLAGKQIDASVAARVSEFMGFPIGGSRESIVRRVGPAGQVFAHEVKRAMSIPRLKAGGFLDEIRDASQGIADQQQVFRIADALQGYGPVTDDIKPAVDVIRKHQQIVASLRQSQDESFLLRKNYMHHDVPSDDLLASGSLRDEIVAYNVHRKAFRSAEEAENFIDTYLGARGGDENQIQELAQYLVRTGQAKNTVEGTAKLKYMFRENPQFRFGGFKEREVNLPLYDPNPIRSHAGYMEGALQDLYITERFGKKGELLTAFAQQLDGKLGSKGILQGESPATFISKFVLGDLPAHQWETASQAIRGFQAATKLQSMAFANMFQGPVGVAMKTDLPTTLRTLKDFTFRHKKAMAWAKSVNQNPSFSAIMMESPGDIVKFFARVQGVTKTEVNNYVMATTAGRYYADKAMRQLISNPTSEKWRGSLVKLGLDPDRILKQGRMTVLDYKIASNNMWRRSQAIPDIMNQPHTFLGFHTAHPATKAFRQFQETAFSQSQQIVDSLFREKGRRFENWMKFMVIFPAAGEVINTMKSVALGRERPETLGGRLLEDYSAAFAFGILNDMWYWGKYGIPRGPFLSDVETVLELLQNPERIPEELTRRIPVPVINERISRSIKESRKESQKVRRQMRRELGLDELEAVPE